MKKPPRGWDRIETVTDSDTSRGAPKMPPPAKPYVPRRKRTH